MPNGAKSQTARNPEGREIPDSAKSRRATNSGTAPPFGAVWHLAPFGISRRSGFRALRHFAPLLPCAVLFTGARSGRSSLRVEGVVCHPPLLGHRTLAWPDLVQCAALVYATVLHHEADRVRVLDVVERIRVQHDQVR